MKWTEGRTSSQEVIKYGGVPVSKYVQILMFLTGSECFFLSTKPVETEWNNTSVRASTLELSEAFLQQCPIRSGDMVWLRLMLFIVTMTTGNSRVFDGS